MQGAISTFESEVRQTGTAMLYRSEVTNKGVNKTGTRLEVRHAEPSVHNTSSVNKVTAAAKTSHIVTAVETNAGSKHVQMEQGRASA